MSRRQRGLSLIELMIAMVTGLLVVGAAATAFVSNQRSTETGIALAEVQARARLALDELAAGIRSAGYIGCAGAIAAAPAVPPNRNASGAAPTDWRPIELFRVEDAGWKPVAPAGYTPPVQGVGRPISGHDALLLEGGFLQGVAVQGTHADGGAVTVQRNYPGLESGAMGLISDCAGAEAFFIAGIDPLADGAVRLDTRAPLLGAYTPQAAFPQATRVMPYRRALYYIGDTARRTPRGEPVHALYEHLFPFDGTDPIEIASGIESIQLRARQRNPSGSSRELSLLHPEFDPARIVGVRLGLLVSSGALHEDAPPKRYPVLGNAIVAGASDGPGYPDDARIRRTFERTVMIRNRDSRRTP